MKVGMHMNLNLICEQMDSSALWINDIADGIFRESVKKALNLAAVTDGQIHEKLYSTVSDGERPLVLVVGYSLPWINRTMNELCAIGCEPILVSVSRLHSDGQFSSVCFDTEDAMRQMVHMIAAAGRRKIALFGIHRDTVGDIAKLTGYARGMRECQLPSSAADIYSRGILSDISECIAARIKNYDAIVCANDLLAIWLTLCLERRGIRVPDDVFVTGFGNWSAVDHYSPRVTRMYTDLSELGCEAVRMHQYMQYSSRADHCSAMLKCTFQPGDTAPISGVCHCRHSLSAMPKSPVWSTDPDILEVLTVERFIRETDDVDHEILAMLDRALTYPAISEVINVSESTVKYRIGRMIRVFGFNDRQQLLDFAAKFNLTNQSISERKLFQSFGE